MTESYWNVNIPPDHHTVDCPSYLLYAFNNPKDRAIFQTPDAEYRPHSWSDIYEIVAANRLDLFRRRPSQLRRYRQYLEHVAQQHGELTQFLLRERLKWSQGNRSSGKALFECEDDYTILRNDWPYGVDSHIVHLVVWAKFTLPCTPATDDLTPATRAAVDAFVRRTFGRDGDGNGDGNGNGDETRQVIWFVNGAALKSVGAIEHVHVMLWDPDPEFVRSVSWTWRGEVFADDDPG